MQIVKGKQEKPLRAVCYGPEGIGKTTFASRWPSPLFIDIEHGTDRLDVDRVQPGSWNAVRQTVQELAASSNGYRTIVFDTADWLERMLAENVCAEKNVTSIEAFSYGKGFVFLAEGWKRFLDEVARMQEATGCHVLFLAHAMMRKQELPDEQGAFDRWELKLEKKSSPVLKEWSDLLLFLNYKTLVIDVDGKKKAQGHRRVMYTNHHACWDAKSRLALPEELQVPETGIPPELATLLVRDNTPAQQPVQQPAQQPVQPAAATVAPEPPGAIDPATEKLLDQLRELMKGSGVTMAELDAELARKGVVPAGTNPKAFNLQTLQRITSKWDAIKYNIEKKRTIRQ